MKQPLTVVEIDQSVTTEEMEGRVLATRRDHAETLQRYHEVWYNAPHTWHYLHFMGVGMMKCPNDLWMYQTLVFRHRPRTIIETGTYQGASALWLAYLQDMAGIEGGKVFTVDFEDRRQCSHPRITFLGGDSADPALVAALAEQVEGPLLVSLDSDHSAEHVLAELELYAPLCAVGDWLVVEDTNIAWDGEAGAGGDRGARGGLEDYLKKHPGEWRQDILAERWLLSMNPGGWLQRMAPCGPECPGRG